MDLVAFTKNKNKMKYNIYMYSSHLLALHVPLRRHILLSFLLFIDFDIPYGSCPLVTSFSFC